MLALRGQFFIVLFLAASQHAGTATTNRLPRPVTQTEQQSARKVALKALHEQFIPAATRSPEFYHVTGIPLEKPRLGEPFLDIRLRPASLDDYAKSSEDDPRTFASLFKYCFPIYVANRPDPIMYIVISRNYDRDRDTVFVDGGELVLAGYYPPGPGMTASAVALRELYGSRVSFVEFLDTSIPRRVIIDGPTGILSGAETDSLAAMQVDARKIKGHLLWQSRH